MRLGKQLLFIFITLTFASAVRAANTPRCAPYEVPIQLDFTVATPEPVTRTVPVAKIKEMTDTGDDTGVHEVGITAAEMLVSIDSTSFAVAAPGSTDARITGQCIYLEIVKVVFGYRTQDIYIASDYAPGSCLYGAVLKHEHDHAAINTDVLRNFAPRIKAVLEEALTREQPVFKSEVGGSIAQNVSTRLDARLTSVLAEFHEAKARRNAEIDTYENRMSVMRSCGAPEKRRKPRARHYYD